MYDDKKSMVCSEEVCCREMTVKQTVEETREILEEANSRMNCIANFITAPEACAPCDKAEEVRDLESAVMYNLILSKMLFEKVLVTANRLGC